MKTWKGEAWVFFRCPSLLVPISSPPRFRRFAIGKDDAAPGTGRVRLGTKSSHSTAGIGPENGPIPAFWGLFAGSGPICGPIPAQGHLCFCCRHLCRGRLVPSEIPCGPSGLRHLLSSRRVLQSIEWHRATSWLLCFFAVRPYENKFSTAGHQKKHRSFRCDAIPFWRRGRDSNGYSKG